MKDNLLSFNFWAKIFLVGLVVHFFAQNFFTYSLGLDLWVFWLWKEFIILWFIWSLVYFVFKNNYLWKFVEDRMMFSLEVVFVSLVVVTFLINYFLIWTSIWEYVMAFRYDFLWFLIFFVVYRLCGFLNKEKLYPIILFYWLVVKVVLIFSLFWYFVILTVPGGLGLFGYDNNIFEWEVWQAPPAAYYTQYNQWLVRNQSLFERPISYWFFLVAFFPLFYVLYLRKKSFFKTWFWWIVYWLNIMSTFSRAAWWAWLIQLIILSLIDYRKNIKKFLKYILLPVVLFFGAIVYFAYDHVVDRQRSNTWHIQEVLIWWDMFTDKPIFWQWAWYVWPASHWWDWQEFNTENQFLQIMVEFWIVGFLPWFLIYMFFVLVGFYYFFKTKEKDRKNDKYLFVLLAFSVGILWLSVQGMVLHSFVDNMIVYPFMFLFALALFLYLKRSD